MYVDGVNDCQGQRCTMQAWQRTLGFLSSSGSADVSHACRQSALANSIELNQLLRWSMAADQPYGMLAYAQLLQH